MDKAEQGRAKKRIAIALRRFLLGSYPSWRYERIFGCDSEYLRAFVEHQFTGGMSWENFTTEWQVGHVVLVSFFDQTNRAETSICWNWVNIRPVQSEHVRSWNPVLARNILLNRKRHFSSNDVVELLLARLNEVAGYREGGSDADWSTFTVENQHDIPLEVEDG